MFTRTRPARKLVLVHLALSYDKTGIPAVRLSKQIGVCDKTAWLMQHKINNALAGRNGGYILGGNVEVDEGNVGAVEYCAGREPGRPLPPGFAALRMLPDAAAGRTLNGFFRDTVQPGSHIRVRLGPERRPHNEYRRGLCPPSSVKVYDPYPTKLIRTIRGSG